MRVPIVQKRGQYGGPTVFYEGVHYPAAKTPGRRVWELRIGSRAQPKLRLVWLGRHRRYSRHRLFWTDPEYARRVEELDAVREHDGLVRDPNTLERHAVEPETGYFTYGKHADGDHRARFHRQNVELEVGDVFYSVNQ